MGQQGHVRRGGRETGPVLLLLHGLGATGAVWDGVAAVAQERWPGPWIVPDLSGHGVAPRRPPYSFGGYAAEVAPLAGGAEDAVVLGHSMGGVVALALASGWFGVRVRTCVGLGIKVRWSDEDLAGAAALAARPARDFPTRADAIARYLRVSGLEGLVPDDAPAAAEGVREHNGVWRLAHDPTSFAVGAPDMPGLLAAARGRVLLAAGQHDGMSTADALRELQPNAEILDGLGHNAHVEDPQAVWDLLTRVDSGA